MRLETFLQNVLQVGIHELVVIVDVQADHFLVLERGGKFIAEPFVVSLFHRKNQVRPTDVAFVDANARVLFRAGRTDNVTLKTVIHFFGRETAPAVLAANK